MNSNNSKSVIVEVGFNTDIWKPISMEVVDGFSIQTDAMSCGITGIIVRTIISDGSTMTNNSTFVPDGIIRESVVDGETIYEIVTRHKRPTTRH